MEEEIEKTINQLSQERAVLEGRFNEIDRIISNLRQIKKVRKNNPNAKTEEERSAMEIPIDRRTGKTFTSQIRQQIFNDSIKDAKKLTK